MLIIRGFVIMTIALAFTATTPDLVFSKDLKTNTLRFAMHTKPETMHPMYGQCSPAAAINDMIFDRLVRLNPQREVIPLLAQSWEISQDKSSYTFYLRKDTYFHDGTPVTAEDVAYSFNLYKNYEFSKPYKNGPISQYYQTRLGYIKDAQAVDKYTIRIKLKEPNIKFLVDISRAGFILPRHLWQPNSGYPDAQKYSLIGSGPYEFLAQTEDKITLIANENYYEGKPALAKIEFMFFEDIAAIWNAMMRSEVDYAGFLPENQFEIMRKDPTFKTHTINAPAYYILAYNLRDPLLSKKEIRRALALALNEQALINKIQNGYGSVCTGPYLSDSWASNPNVKPIGYNPFKAKESFLKNGFEFKDGYLTKDGNPLTFNLLYNQKDQNNEKIALILRQQLQEIGIKLNIDQSKEEYIYDDPALVSRDFQIWLTVFASYQDPAYMNYMDQDSPIGSIIDVSSFKLLNKLLKESHQTYDQEKRQALYHQIHSLMYDDQVFGYLFSIQYLFAVNARFTHTESFFKSYLTFYYLKDWHEK
jgi:peptide/nickel transport system substrate-binding protein